MCRVTTGERLGQAIRTGGRGERERDSLAGPPPAPPGADQRERLQEREEADPLAEEQEWRTAQQEGLETPSACSATTNSLRPREGEGETRQVEDRHKPAERSDRDRREREREKEKERERMREKSGGWRRGGGRRRRGWRRSRGGRPRSRGRKRRLPGLRWRPGDGKRRGGLKRKGDGAKQTDDLGGENLRTEGRHIDLHTDPVPTEHLPPDNLRRDDKRSPERKFHVPGEPPLWRVSVRKFPVTSRLGGGGG